MRQVVSNRTIAGIRNRLRIAPEIPVPMDSYKDRILKYIPVEAIVVFIALYGIASSQLSDEPYFLSLSYGIFIICGIVAVLYLWRVEDVGDHGQLVVSVLAYIVWVYSLGVLPFAGFWWYNAIFAGLLLPVYTFCVPLIDGKPV
jgi:hypothetical protein